MKPLAASQALCAS